MTLRHTRHPCPLSLKCGRVFPPPPLLHRHPCFLHTIARADLSGSVVQVGVNLPRVVAIPTSTHPKFSTVVPKCASADVEAVIPNAGLKMDVHATRVASCLGIFPKRLSESYPLKAKAKTKAKAKAKAKAQAPRTLTRVISKTVDRMERAF